MTAPVQDKGREALERCPICRSGTKVSYDTHDGRPKFTCTRCGRWFTRGKSKLSEVR